MLVFIPFQMEAGEIGQGGVFAQNLVEMGLRPRLETVTSLHLLMEELSALVLARWTSLATHRTAPLVNPSLFEQIINGLADQIDSCYFFNFSWKLGWLVRLEHLYQNLWNWDPDPNSHMWWACTCRWKSSVLWFWHNDPVLQHPGLLGLIELSYLVNLITSQNYFHLYCQP